MQVRGELEQTKADEPEKLEKVKAPRREVCISPTRLLGPSHCYATPYRPLQHVAVVKIHWLMAQDTEFHTSIGRGVFDAIFNPPMINVSEQFLPRRTAFMYELDDDGFNSDIPTTLRRSKADCPPVS